MRSVNKVTLLGYVGKKPEIIFTTSGAMVANLSLATSYKLKATNGGEARDVTEWHRLKAFKKTAEIIRDHVTKGAPLYIEGALQTRSWEKDGEKRYVTEIVIHELSMLGKKDAAAAPVGGGDPVDEATAAAERARDTRNLAPDGTEIDDNDIPF